MQTRYGYPDGNCFAACVASILELSIDEVPEISAAGETWYQDWSRWLAARGLWMFTFPVHNPDGGLNFTPPGYAILGTQPANVDRGDAPDDVPVGHAVVAFEGEPIHDPHPFDDIGAWQVWTVFATLNPVAHPLEEDA